jgi:hypothetical protein
VQVLGVAGALVIGALGAARSRTWRQVGIASVAWLVELLPGPFVLLAGTARAAAGRRWSSLAPVARGAALATLLVLIFGALFVSADAAFSHAVSSLFDWHVNGSDLVARGLVMVIVLAVAGALWRVNTGPCIHPALPATAAFRLGRIEWLIGLGALMLLFIAFVALQLTTLFGGDAHVLRTAGLTYADYARQGFGQLTIAGVLTLAVVAAAARYGPAGDRAIRVLTGALCALTLVVLASALHRLDLYEAAYGATRLRFMVHAELFWLAAVIVLILVAGATGRARHLPRALVLLTGITGLLFVLANPDARIAHRNVTRYASTGQLDLPYLTSLSADAVPQLRALPPAVAACAADLFAHRLPHDDSAPAWNFGRSRATNLLPSFGADQLRNPCDTVAARAVR